MPPALSGSSQVRAGAWLEDVCTAERLEEVAEHCEEVRVGSNRRCSSGDSQVEAGRPVERRRLGG